jgi:hypothetical protein
MTYNEDLAPSNRKYLNLKKKIQNVFEKSDKKGFFFLGRLNNL